MRNYRLALERAYRPGKNQSVGILYREGLELGPWSLSRFTGALERGGLPGLAFVCPYFV